MTRLQLLARGQLGGPPREGPRALSLALGACCGPGVAGRGRYHSPTWRCLGIRGQLVVGGA